MADIIERYLDAIASHDWDVVDECIADDIVRVGPYRDGYVGRHDYMAFIVDLMPNLKGYLMEVDGASARSEDQRPWDLASRVAIAENRRTRFDADPP